MGFQAAAPPDYLRVALESPSTIVSVKWVTVPLASFPNETVPPTDGKDERRVILRVHRLLAPTGALSDCKRAGIGG